LCRLPRQQRSSLQSALAASVPVRVLSSGETIAFVVAHTSERTSLVFPYGYTAWSAGGITELISPSGTVVAREGHVIEGLMGSAADNGDFVLCFDLATRLTVTPGT
jgi:hypothetical protein